MEYARLAIPPATEALAGIPTPLIADTIERLIAELDARDGDPDLDQDGDEADGTNAEDEHLFGGAAGTRGAGWMGGPGCEVSDQGEEAYPEWHTRGRYKAAPFRGSLPSEDAEDDDPDHGADEAEPDFSPNGGEGPGCSISDPGGSDLER